MVHGPGQVSGDMVTMSGLESLFCCAIQLQTVKLQTLENLRKTFPYKQLHIFYRNHAPMTISTSFLLMIFVAGSAFGERLCESCNAFSLQFCGERVESLSQLS